MKRQFVKSLNVSSLLLLVWIWSCGPSNDSVTRHRLEIFAAEQSFNSTKLAQIVEKADLFSGHAIKALRGKTVFDRSGALTGLIVYGLHAHDWGMETAKIELSNYQVKSIQADYLETPEDLGDQTDSFVSCPDETVDVVFYLTDSNVSSSVKALDVVEGYATQMGLVHRTYIDNMSTTLYKNYLSCSNLKLMMGFAHGSPSTLILNGGNISYTFFSGLGAGYLDCKVVYMNSCQVHNNPMLNAVLSAGPQKFIGGIDNLAMGPSDEVFKCWFLNAVKNGKDICPTLHTCDDSQPASGEHGCSGNGPETPVGCDDPNPTPTPTPGPTPTPTPGPTPTPTPTPGKSCANPSGGTYCGKKSPDGCWCDSLCAQYNDCCPDKKQICDDPQPTPTPTPNPTPTPSPTPTPGKSCANPSGGTYCGKKSPDGCWCDSLCVQYNDCCPDKKQICG